MQWYQRLRPASRRHCARAGLSLRNLVSDRPPRADTRMDKQNDVRPESTLCGGKAVLIDRRGERCESSKYRPRILTWPRPFSNALSGHFSRQLYPADSPLFCPA